MLFQTLKYFIPALKPLIATHPQNAHLLSQISEFSSDSETIVLSMRCFEGERVGGSCYFGLQSPVTYWGNQSRHMSISEAKKNKTTAVSSAQGKRPEYLSRGWFRRKVKVGGNGRVRTRVWV